MSGLAVIGAGMAACGAAHRASGAGVRARLYDGRAEPGGEGAARISPDGFVFDGGPHALATEDPRLEALFAEAVENRFEEHRARVRVFWKGHWIEAPPLVHLHGLPEDVTVGCLRDYAFALAAGDEAEAAAANHQEWLAVRYGASYASTFPAQMALKLSTREARHLVPGAGAGRSAPASLDDVLHGALSPAPRIDRPRVRCPSAGGFGAYRAAFLGRAELQLDRRVVSIDPVRRELSFADGASQEYAAVVSAAPLPQTVAMIADAPPEVRQAAGALAWAEAVQINLGVDRADLSDSHWIDFPDQDYVFARVRFPANLAPAAAPEGCGAVQCEMFFSRDHKPRPEDPEELLEVAEEDLRRCGLLRETDQVIFTDMVVQPYAHVIFDHQRAAALATVQGFLRDVGVIPAGQFGLWGAHDAAEAFVSGEEAAEAALAQMSGASTPV